MANVQNFNPDVYHALQQVIQEMRESHPAKMPQALASITETAQKNGLPVIVKNCENAEAGSQAFIKMTENLLELCEDYCKQAKEFFDSFGIEY